MSTRLSIAELQQRRADREARLARTAIPYTDPVTGYHWRLWSKSDTFAYQAMSAAQPSGMDAAALNRARAFVQDKS